MIPTSLFSAYGAVLDEVGRLISNFTAHVATCLVNGFRIQKPSCDPKDKLNKIDLH